jgi:hypothetical protein
MKRGLENRCLVRHFHIPFFAAAKTIAAAEYYAMTESCFKYNFSIGLAMGLIALSSNARPA